MTSVSPSVANRWPRARSSLAQLPKVVDLAVEHDHDRPVLAVDRLIAGDEVDDPEALDAEAHRAARGTARASRDPDARARRTSARGPGGRPIRVRAARTFRRSHTWLHDKTRGTPRFSRAWSTCHTRAQSACRTRAQSTCPRGPRHRRRHGAPAARRCGPPAKSRPEPASRRPSGPWTNVLVAWTFDPNPEGAFGSSLPEASIPGAPLNDRRRCHQPLIT